MAIPSDISGLRVWYKADSESYSDGDAVGTVTDRSGLGYNASQSTASLKPIFRTNRVNGLAAYDFDGVDDAANNGTAMDTIMGTGAHTYFAVFKPHSASQAFDSYKRAEGVFGMKAHDFISVGSEGGVASVSAEFYTGNVGDPNPEYVVLPVTLNDWHYATMVWDSSADLYFYLDGSISGSVTAATTTSRVANNALQLGYNDGVSPVGYFDGEIAEVFAYNVALSSTDRKSMEDYIRGKYFPSTPSQTEQVRDSISRRLWIRRQPNGLLTVKAPLWMMDADILDRVYIESPFGPDSSGLGWGPKRWQRRAFSVLRSEPEPNTGTVNLTLLDRRPVDALLWDGGWSRMGGSGARADGVARFWPGGTRTYTRTGRAYASNPADSGQITAHIDNDPCISYNGELFEPEATNQITRSSFVSGTTGLTVVAGSGGAAALDTTDLLFAPNVTTNSFKLTGGTTESSVAFPATGSLTGSLRVSVDHYDDSNGALGLRIYDGTNYWDDSAGTWGSLVTNSLPVTQDKSASRWVSKAMSVTSKAITVTAVVTVNTRICHVYHAQVEVSSHATSRIVTDGAAATRGKSRLLIGNNSGTRCVNAAQGTLLAEVIPDWATADIGNTNRGIFYAYHDASNYLLVQYNGTSDRFEFLLRRSGTTVTAYKATTVVAGTAYKIAARWTGVEAELDLAAYTASIFVDGVKGTDATAAGTMTETGTANLEVGSTGDAENWGGAIRRRLSRPYPMTDAEIGRFEA